ncbi:hypothetical protein TNCV_2170481, partial [Trichonephila clavipes]
YLDACRLEWRSLEKYFVACRMEWRSLEKKGSRRGCSLGYLDACRFEWRSLEKYFDAGRMEWISLEKKGCRRGCSLEIERSLRMLNVRGSNPAPSTCVIQSILPFSRYLDACRMEWRALEKGSFIFPDTWTLVEWNGDLYKSRFLDGGLAHWQSVRFACEMSGVQTPVPPQLVLFRGTFIFPGTWTFAEWNGNL